MGLKKDAARGALAPTSVLLYRDQMDTLRRIGTITKQPRDEILRAFIDKLLQHVDLDRCRVGELALSFGADAEDTVPAISKALLPGGSDVR